MKRLFKHIVIALVVSAIIYLGFSAYYLVTFGHINIAYFKSNSSLLGLSYGICLYLTHGYASDVIHRRFPGRNDVYKRLIIFVSVSVVLTCFVVFLLNFLFSVVIGQSSFEEFLQRQSWNNYIPNIILALLVGLSFYAFAYYQEYKNRQVDEQRQIAGGATAQFESLKSQIDPHFLFNSLNVLISLIEEDQKKAIAYTTSLSKMYRYILEQKDKELVPITEELRFADNFMTLLKLRFEHALFYEADTDIQDHHLMTVPLVLQLLLENTIKHNKATEEKVLHISIALEGDYLVVKNNLQEKKHVTDSTKFGLQNIRDRYRLLTDTPVEIIRSEKEFKVRLPILTIA